MAEAFEEYGQAAILDMITDMLPEYAKEVAGPLSNIDKITVVDTGGKDSQGGANKVSGYATDLMSTLQESLKASSGIDVKEMLESMTGKRNDRSEELDFNRLSHNSNQSSDELAASEDKDDDKENN